MSFQFAADEEAPPRYYSKVAAARLAHDPAAQLDRLQYTVSQARNAPIYKDRLAGTKVTTLKDLEGLPFTTKADLKGNPADDFLACPKEKVWHFHESFGTTGRPVVGWYTLEDIEVEIDVIGRWLAEYGPGKVVMNRYPYAFPVPAQLVETACRLMGGTLIPTSNMTYNVGYQRVLRLMKERRTNVLTSMPLEAVLLKEAALVAGMDPRNDFPDLEAYAFAGRILTPSWRASMIDDWGVKVHNLYGCTEGGPFATSCEHGHLHLHEEFFIFEVVDPVTKEPLRDEAPTGTLVATTLCREAQPMIRYYTDDLVRVLPSPCECGRTSRAIEVLGRAGGLKSFGGKEVTDFALEEEILAWSRRYYANVFFVCITKRGFLVRLEAHDPKRVDAADGSRRLTERLGVPVRVEVVPRGYLINHASLVTQPAVFKPRMVCDHRVESRKVINTSGGLIDWWAEFTPKLIGQVLIKSVRDFFAKWRIRLLG
ncbi:MAG: phenylacetate--CoA ligase family protein [Proteobacteria bacterium]|nr:phenylacetate--CoA ligase family protein [Pseudomonadota bacterium]